MIVLTDVMRPQQTQATVAPEQVGATVLAWMLANPPAHVVTWCQRLQDAIVAGDDSLAFQTALTLGVRYRRAQE